MTRKFLHVLIVVTFIGSLVTPFPQAHADSLLGLPEPGSMVNLSPAYEPILIKGLKIHPENPFLFDFIIDTGNDMGAIGNRPYMKNESQKLIKYFLASMTIPEKDLWVNLSPYEKNRMITSNLAQTEMGRDMLAQDYILKQLTASLIYPEDDLGKTFWNQVYSNAQQKFGTTQIPVNTFNKVWIVADRADVYEHDNAAYIVGAHLKVMLEEDYLALQKHLNNVGAGSKAALSEMNNRAGLEPAPTDINKIGSQIIREIVIPAITKEVNQGKNFAPLRQMFYSMILASWYKTALKNAILTQVYGNQSKVKIGINQTDPKVNEQIFIRYLHAYKKGVFNYIKEDEIPNFFDHRTGPHQIMPRKYFSGGANIWQYLRVRILHFANPAMLGNMDHAVMVRVNTIPTRLNNSLSYTLINNKAMLVKPHQFNYEDAKAYLATMVYHLDLANKQTQGLIRLNMRSGQLLMAVNPRILENSKLVDLRNLLEPPFNGNNHKGNEWITVDMGWGGNGYLNSLKLITPSIRNPQDITEGYSQGMRGFMNEDLPKDSFNAGYQGRVHDEIIQFSRLIESVLPNPRQVSVDVPLYSFPEFNSTQATLDQLAQLKFVQPVHLLDTDTILSHQISLNLLNGDNKQERHNNHFIKPKTTGGIDFNARNMRIKIQQKGQGVHLNVDAATLSRIRTEGIDGVEFNIQSITPVVNLPIELGFDSSLDQSKSATISA